MAKNSIGESISREARMTVLQADSNLNSPSRPQFAQAPAGNNVLHIDDESDSILMHCIANGNPRPRISWSLNNQPLRESEHLHVYDNGTLAISAPIEQDEGNYKCEATNYQGKVSTIAIYRISGKSAQRSCHFKETLMCSLLSLPFISSFLFLPQKTNPTSTNRTNLPSQSK